jgi:hypothetical protein
MRTTKQEVRKVDRRHLLKGAGLALGAAAASTSAAAAKEAVPAKRQAQHAGYRETDSVRTYYKLARF